MKKKKQGPKPGPEKNPKDDERLKGFITKTVHDAVDKAIKDRVVPEGYHTCAECGGLVKDNHKCPYCKKKPEKPSPPSPEPTKQEPKEDKKDEDDFL